LGELLNNLELFNKNFVITGANGYLGSAITQGALEAGCNVLALSRSEGNLLDFKRRFPDQLTIKLIDCCNEIQLGESIATFHEANGAIHGLVNNVYSAYRRPQLMQEKKFILETFESSFVSYWLALRQVRPFLHLEGSSIVNNGSLWGLVSPNPSNYLDLENEPSLSLVVSKAAVHQFTKYAAVLLSAEKVRVNTIVPGWFPKKRGAERKDYIEGITKQIPLSRIGTPRDIVGPVLFLLSPLSSYITGQELIVDGGYTLT
jgi:gluconate 5-dehydrogenase